MPATFEQIFSALLLREELEYHLDSDVERYRASPMSRWDSPSMVMVFASTLRSLRLLTMKPVMYIANVSEEGFDNNPLLDQVKAFASRAGAVVVAVCASVESEISQLDEEDRAAFLAELGQEASGLARVIEAGYRLLGLLTFFTAGPNEVRAWTVRAGSTAPKAAGRIHTDFERGFIRAEVYTIDALEEYKTEAGLKSAGKLRVEGKEYDVQDGDVMHFRFNV